jgi:hypothetical protein
MGVLDALIQSCFTISCAKLVIFHHNFQGSETSPHSPRAEHSWSAFGNSALSRVNGPWRKAVERLLEKLRSVHTVKECNSGYKVKDKEMGEDFRANRINDIVYAYAEG